MKKFRIKFHRFSTIFPSSSADEPNVFRLCSSGSSSLERSWKVESARRSGESYLRGGQCQGDQLISLSMRDYVTNWKHGAPIARACVPYVLDLWRKSCAGTGALQGRFKYLPSFLRGTLRVVPGSSCSSMWNPASFLDRSLLEEKWNFWRLFIDGNIRESIFKFHVIEMTSLFFFIIFLFVRFLLVSRGISVGSNEKTFDIQKFTAYILDYRLLVYVWQLFIQCLTRKHFIYLKTGWHFDI